MPTLLDESTPLEHYGHNLTRLAKLGAFSPLAGQEAEVNRMFHILLKKNKCNPAILGSYEGERWAIVAETVRRMASGDAPDPLPTKQVIRLDYEMLFASLPDDLSHPRVKRSYSFDPLIHAQPGSQEWAFLEQLCPQSHQEKGDTADKRLRSLFAAMSQASGSFILFVDHFHCIFGGEWDRYQIDMAPLLKSMLARRQVQLIGACTLEQYRQHIECDASIQRRCQEICLLEAEDKKYKICSLP